MGNFTSDMLNFIIVIVMFINDMLHLIEAMFSFMCHMS